MLAAIAARDAQYPARFIRSLVDGGDLAGGPVDGVNATVQPYRVGAVAGRRELGLPASELVTGGEVE